MSNFVEEKLAEFEEECARSLPERAGKLIFVGLVTLVASAIAERAFDKFVDNRRAPVKYVPVDLITN